MPREKVLSEPVALSCATIADQDNGMAGVMIDAEIANAVRDLMDRASEDGKPRIVKIQLELALANGIVITNVACAMTPIPRRTKSTVMNPRMTRKDHTDLFFQPTNRENPDQRTFLADDDGEIPNE